MENLDLTKHIPLDKTCLIEASAGTGKTYSIAHVFLHALLSGMPVEKILVVTFTEAATKELRSRIRENVANAISYLKANGGSDQTLKTIIFDLFSNIDAAAKQKLLEVALLNIDQAAIFTIHSFCQRMLTENAFESKIAYGAELLTDHNEIILELAENFWREKLLNISDEVKELYGGIKFDDILTLTKELVRYHDIEVVNNEPGEYEVVPDGDEALDSKYADIITETNAWLDLFNNEDLESEIVALFDKVPAEYLKKDYNENLVVNLGKLIKALAEYKTANIKLFTSDGIAKAVTVAAKKQGIAVLEHELFEFNSRYLDIVKQQQDLDKAIAVAIDNNQQVMRQELYNNLNDYIKIKFNVIKDERNILTFNDLLVRLYNVLNDEKTALVKPLTRLIRAKFSVALVDEFQDTDDIQYEIFNLLFGDKNGTHGFFMIGDPKQSIYRFRGADIFSYLTAKNSADYAFTLGTNYRSEVKMVEVANRLFGIKGEDSFAFPPQNGKPGIIYEAVTPGPPKAELIDQVGHNQSLQFWLVNGYNDKFAERNIAFNMAEEIIRLIDIAKVRFSDDKLLTPGDVAILVNTNVQASMVKDILAKSKIPAVIQNSLKIFESWEARELQLWLKAVINPIERHIRPLLITNLLKYSVEQIDNLQDQTIMALTEELTLLNKLWQQNGFFSIFLRFIHHHQVQQRALGQLDGERIITNYIHLAELLHKYELKNGRGIEKILTYLEYQIADSDSDDEYMQRLESDSQAVKIMTIHRSKGLEFPVVFAPFLWSNVITKGEKKKKIFLFNEIAGDNYIQKLDFGADEEFKKANRLLARRETVAEHIRLMYVAVTRAANRCYLPVADLPNTGKTIFSYLFTDEILSTKDGCQGFISKLDGKGSKATIEVLKQQTIKAISEFVDSIDDASVEVKNEVNHTLQLNPARQGTAPELEVRRFPNKNLYKWGVGSFSSLIKNQPYKGEPTEQGPGIAALPKGKNFGIAVHTIFQNYFTLGKTEFYANVERNIEAPLKIESYFCSANDKKRGERFDTVQTMLNNIFDLPISVAGSSLQLGKVTPDNAKAELKFFYKINKISPALLTKSFAAHGIDDIKEFKTTLATLNFSLRKGYMNGEIDLLFRADGKYYVLDWKTNHLGPQATDYHHLALRENMAEHYYILQYHIYTLAVHLFLQQQLKNYSYDNDFGGILYIYTRGIDGNGNGIFFDRPSQALIEDLEHKLVK